MVHDPQDRSVSPAAFPQVPASPFADFTFGSYREAALHWLDFGFRVIPIVPGKKVTAVRWDPWLDGLSAQKVDQHWRRHPDHEVGFIVGDDYIVFDADTLEACTTLEAVEAKLGIEPSLIVRTKRGAHHYFRREAGANIGTMLATGDNPSLKIDIKTGRSMVVLPPSTGKVVDRMTIGVRHGSELTVASWAFVVELKPDARRGEPTKRETQADEPRRRAPHALPLLRECLARLDPDLTYQIWFRIAAVVFNTTGAMEEGYLLFDEWSRQGRKYKGQRETRGLWNHLDPETPNPVTLGFLRKLLTAGGHDWEEICCDADGRFEILEEEAA